MFSTEALTATSTGNTASDKSKEKLQDDLNQFLNLLVTQLQNQDPLEPMDATQFTNQLVQFASVEQQIYQNANLEKLLGAYEQTQVSSLTGYLGTTVESNGDTLELANSTAKFSYTLYDQAAANAIIITDIDGKMVFTGNGERTEGRHEFIWDGTDGQGNVQPDGIYTATVAPLDKAGELAPYSQTVYGLVTSAGADQGKVTLFINSIAVPLEDVVAVAETPPAVP